MSDAEAVFVQAQVRHGASLIHVLARRDGTGEPVPVAAIETRAIASPAAQIRVAVRIAPARGGPALELLTLEQLYAQLQRMDGEAHYCIDAGNAVDVPLGSVPCDGEGARLSHVAVLRELAALRSRAAESTTGRQIRVTPWRSVSLEPSSVPSANADDVSVKVLDGDRPLPGRTVHFSRAPHAGCSAETGPTGEAGCRLVDQHGEACQHTGDHTHAVVVTFPGDLSPERVLLPTTSLLPPRRFR